MNPIKHIYFLLEYLEYAVRPVWIFFFFSPRDTIGDKCYALKYSLSTNKMINHISRDF